MTGKRSTKRFEWLKVKGQHWKKEDCQSNVKLCYNCIANTLSEEFNVVTDINENWCNLQVVGCCKAVSSALQDKTDKRFFNSLEKVTYDDVINALAYIKDLIKQVINGGLQKGFLIEVQRLAFCTCIVWLTNNSDFNYANSLANQLIYEDCTFFSESPESNFFLRMLLSSNFGIPYANDECKGNLSCIGKLHNSALFYIFAHELYRQKQHEIVLKTCLDYLGEHENTDTSVYIPLLHNMVASCYMFLSKPLTAVVHWRKAIQCQHTQHFMIPILFNVHLAYEKSDMIEASCETITCLSSALSNNNLEKLSTTPVFVLNLTNSEEKSRIHVATNNFDLVDAAAVKYYIGKYFLTKGMNGKAIAWLQDFLKHTKEKFKPSPSPPYVMQIHVPHIIQIYAELGHAYALLGTNSETLPSDYSELCYSASNFKTSQLKAPLTEVLNASVDVKDIEVYNVAAVTFYHYVCVLIFKINSHILSDSSQAKSEIEHCLLEMESVLPAMKLDGNGSVKELSKQVEFYLRVTEKLANAKAKLYFNKALVCTASPQEQMKEILESLQAALRYDSRNLEMRWNVVMLLWKVGQKQESIKTWCKTRDINYRQSRAEIQFLRNEKSALLNGSNSRTKLDLLQKDISILNELLTFY